MIYSYLHFSLCLPASRLCVLWVMRLHHTFTSLTASSGRLWMQVVLNECWLNMRKNVRDMTVPWDACMSKPRDVLESPGVSPQPCRQEMKGHGPVFHLRSVLVYRISLGEEFLAIPLLEFSLGKLLFGQHPNCKTHWASLMIGGEWGWGVDALPWVSSTSAPSLRVWSATSLFLFWRPLPLSLTTGQSEN